MSSTYDLYELRCPNESCSRRNVIVPYPEENVLRCEACNSLLITARVTDSRDGLIYAGIDYYEEHYPILVDHYYRAVKKELEDPSSCDEESDRLKKEFAQWLDALKGKLGYTPIQ